MEPKEKRTTRYDERNKKYHITVTRSAPLKNNDGDVVGESHYELRQTISKTAMDAELAKLHSQKTGVEQQVKNLKHRLTEFKDDDFENVKEFAEKLKLAQRFEEKNRLSDQLKSAEETLKNLKKDINEIKNTLS